MAEIKTPWTFNTPISDRDGQDNIMHGADSFDLKPMEAERAPKYGLGDLFSAVKIRSGRD